MIKYQHSKKEKNAKVEITSSSIGPESRVLLPSNLGEEGEVRRKFVRGLVAVPAMAVVSGFSGRLHLPSGLRTLVPADYIQNVLNAVQDWTEPVDIGTIMGVATNTDSDTWIKSLAANQRLVQRLLGENFRHARRLFFFHDR